MAVTFGRAQKRKCKLKLAVAGPSGSGKTYSALRIAKGIGGRVAVIDTERGSAAKYGDRFEFDTCDLADRSIDGYVNALKSAAEAGYGVVVIDSMTHAWQELVAKVDRLARAKYSGNTWSAWSEGTPEQRKLVNALLDYPGHLIATMRTKTEWSVQADEKGRNKPVRVGLAPEQGKGIEYEFDLLMEISPEHIANVIKDRTGKFQDRLIEKPGEDLGRELLAWLEDGATPAEPVKPADLGKPAIDQAAAELAKQLLPSDTTALMALVEKHGMQDSVEKWCGHFKVASLAELSQEQVDAIVRKIEKKLSEGTNA